MEEHSTASAERKKEIMVRLRKLNEEMKAPSSSSTNAAASGSTPKVDEKEQKEKERLDKELELHHVSTNAEGEEESTEELKAKLEKLKAEVRSQLLLQRCMDD